MIVPADSRPAPEPVVTVRGDGHLRLSPEAIRAAARLLLGVVQARRERQAQEQPDQAGDGTEARKP
jgi:hypothetical protein